MATIMTKRGTQDNVLTYEHICDTTKDMGSIDPQYITLGSTCLVTQGKSGGTEAYIANSNKEWIEIVGGSDSSDNNSSSGSGDVIYITLRAPNSGSFNYWQTSSFSYALKRMTVDDPQPIDIGPAQESGYPRVGYLTIMPTMLKPGQGPEIAQGSFSAIPSGLTQIAGLSEAKGRYLYAADEDSDDSALMIIPLTGASYDPVTDTNEDTGWASAIYAFAFFILDDKLLNKLNIDLCFYPATKNSGV